MSEINSTPASPASAAAKPQESITPVKLAVVFLLLAIIVSVVGWAGYVWWNSKDRTIDWRRFAFQLQPPKLVEVTGQVLYNGQPVTEGSIVTEFSEEGLFGGLSVLDKEGRFRLMTQIEGRYHDGVYVGEHTVAIFSYSSSSGAGAPAGLVPQKYLTHSTTPLRMVVTSDSENTPVIFKLTGELESSGRRGFGGPSDGGQGGGGDGAAPNPEEIISRILESDKNEDGKISKDEASDRLKQNFDRADENGDGFIDEAELKTLVEGFGRR
jgi:uncharacterized membrane protein YgcG